MRRRSPSASLLSSQEVKSALILVVISGLRLCRWSQEFGKHGDEYHRLYAGYPSGAYKVNAVELTEPLAPYEMLCGLLVPLYVPRATEEVLYGRRGVTLQTSREVTGSASTGHRQGLVKSTRSARQ